MPYAMNQGIKIYYEVEGEGLPIILAHGSTGNTTFWHGYGYVKQLREQFTVVLYDARGHGKSDKPHEVEAYNNRLMVDDVIAIIDELSISRIHYWGYSMGGYTGLGMAKYYPERLSSLIFGGTDLLHQPSDSDEPDVLLQLFQKGVDGGADVVIEGMKALAGSITPQYEQRLRSMDFQAMVACIKNFRFIPSFIDSLSTMEMPCLLYAGDQDTDAYNNAPEAVRRLPDASFVSLPGLNHVSASAATDSIMPHVLSFLTGVET